uniref:Angiotensin-converting enzyme 2 n=1 Tax=Davidia involucrata TaxID=16924 RepID=A0A5B6Z7W5_DAVIN
MKNAQDSQNTPELQSSTQVSHESQSDQQNNATEAPVADSGSISISSNDNTKVSREDIELVQNLIERCLQLYMNRDEVVKTLLNRARIDPGFTTLVWQKLEEENADFFRAYYIRLKLKKQIILFNHLLEHQYHLTVPPKVPLAPIQNGIHPMPVNNLPMGYPVLQQPPVPATGQPHLDSMGCGISSCHVVNGVPAPGNFHPIRMNSGNDMVINNNAADVAPAIPPSSAMSSMSEMPVSPTSVASTGHFPFTASEISGMGVDTSALDAAFTSDVASSVGLQLAPDTGAGNSRDSLRSLAQIPWNFSLSDLTADLSNLGDLGALGNYPGSPFLPSDSDILLDSPEQEDIVEEFFVDSVPGPPCSQSDEEKC